VWDTRWLDSGEDLHGEKYTAAISILEASRERQ
jgi:hypothetical protein